MTADEFRRKVVELAEGHPINYVLIADDIPGIKTRVSANTPNPRATLAVLKQFVKVLSQDIVEEN